MIRISPYWLVIFGLGGGGSTAEEVWSRLVLPVPTDGANCTCKKVRVKNTRVVLYSRV